ncbi:hypothetical protein ACFL43_05980, partial [Thermodesulfobacteriota bacterium]
PFAALKTFRDDPQAYDLIITDQVMTGMTGEDLARELLGIRACVPKPYKKFEITALIRQVLKETQPPAQPVRNEA